MDLSTLTPDQRDCVTHVDGPLLVSAGAGSGKTLMLTKRIVYALLHPEASGVHDIDEVLAITFTELAAGEIKSRVRAGLREEGLAEAALKVDACWISTIHGMCARILRESAFDLGLNPRFSLLDDTDRDQLIEDCVNRALAEVRAADPDDPDEGAAVSPAFADLFAEFEKADGSSSVGEMASDLVKKAANIRGGLDAVVCRDAPEPREIAGDVLGAMERCDAAAREGIARNGKQKDKFTQAARDALENEACGMPVFERLQANAACGYRDVAVALANVDLSFGTNTRKEPYATAYALLRQACIDGRLNCALGIAQPARAELLALARRVQELFRAAKAERGTLDQDDLLLRTLDAFETHPDIEARYRNRFKLVMVDEFQDTSAIQVALIGHLTDGDRRLCTVGDTQQSIYRFRGADVGTYRAHKRAMRRHEGSGGLYRELGKNFRSHGDVIAFVNRVFGDPEVFGSSGEFIELDWVADHAAANPFPDVARIDVVATTCPRGKGLGTEERHLVEAEEIARRFESLHAEAPNRRWGDMVVLLGTMKRADVYAATLRAHGIPCIVTGGSGFSWTPEAQEVGALLGAVANPWDDASLRAALGGAAFGLGAEELLRLGSADDGGMRHLWQGLTEARGKDSSARVRLAASLLADAVDSAAQAGASRTLTDVAVSSGWLERLQGQGPQGMASAANVLKAIRLVESIENDPSSPRGVPATAARFARKLEEGYKDKPGSLMTAGQDAVRILTVHASKGLEFPIVALADFYGLRSETGRLRLETTGDRIYLSLLPSASVADGTPLEGFLELKLTDKQRERLVDAGHIDESARPTPLDAEDAADFHRAVTAASKAGEFGELRRKFYVGATRPREALVLAVNMNDSSTGHYHDVLEDLRRGLFGPMGDFATAPEGLDFGGSRRASVERLRLERDAGGTLLVNGMPAGEFLAPGMRESAGDPERDDAARPSPAAVPEVPRPGERLGDLLPVKRACNPLRAGTFSYSSLGRSDYDVAPPTDPDEVPTGLSPSEPTAMAETGEGGTWVPEPTGSARSEGAVAFGSALHQCCQIMAERLAAARRPEGGGAACERGGAFDRGTSFEEPDEGTLLACLRTWGAPDEGLPALAEAVRMWARSEVAAEAARHRDLVPEAPLYVELPGPQGEPTYLEGSIDLLCHDHLVPPAGQTAFAVDYKTGGSASETPERLQEKHLLQATCYAYAVLAQGYAAVELAFVRVQQRDREHPDQPQTVRYRFDHGQLQELAERIRDAYARRAN